MNTGETEEFERKLAFALKNANFIQGPVDFEVFNIFNTYEEDTGVVGIICVTSARTSQVPYVEWSKTAGAGDGFRLSIQNTLKVFDSQLSKQELDKYHPLVKEWVDKNKKALMWFWNNASEITMKEVISFSKTKLKKI